MFPQVYYVVPFGWYHLVVFGALIPWMAWKSRARMMNPAVPLPSRLRHLRSQAMLLIAFASLSLVTANRQSLDLFPARWPSPSAIALGAGVWAAAVWLMRPYWKRAVVERRRVVQLFMADTPAEQAWWIAVSVLAGISEEITWRAVQFALLSYLAGSATIGALACAALFGAAHIVQGWKSAMLITGFALVFQALVLWSGSLYVAMVVHAAYDITAGLTYGRLGRRAAAGQAGLANL